MKERQPKGDREDKKRQPTESQVEGIVYRDRKRDSLEGGRTK
jgi:hypothetical protein